MNSYASWHDARTQFVHLDFGSNSVRALHYSLDMVEIRHAGSADLLVPPCRFFFVALFSHHPFTHPRRSHRRLNR